VNFLRSFRSKNAASEVRIDVTVLINIITGRSKSPVFSVTSSFYIGKTYRMTYTRYDSNVGIRYETQVRQGTHSTRTVAVDHHVVPSGGCLGHRSEVLES
jgi:hypothetical protein